MTKLTGPAGGDVLDEAGAPTGDRSGTGARKTEREAGVADLSSLRRIAFERFSANGDLTVFPSVSGGVPFPIMRVFTIAGVSRKGRRADHAHRDCTQMLSCLSGSVEVLIRNGRDTVVERLRADGTALLIPPMLWNSVVFEGPETVLAVFCDLLYEEADYIRDWDEYVRLLSD